MAQFQPNFRISNWPPLQRDLLVALVCLLTHASYLMVGYAQNRILGFPLDDAWIYQTYARNLAEMGQWAFVPGEPSTGSTSLLWTPLLVPGHWLSIDPFWWANLVGLASLIFASLGAVRFFSDAKPMLALALGLAVAFEWHMVWMAASGMETILFTGLLIWFWRGVLHHDPAEQGHNLRDGFILGLFGGLLMLTRPEGLLALAVAGLYGLLAQGKISDRLKWGLAAGAGFGLMIAFFLGFNYAISGEVLPNTFYAKQTEYEILRSLPLIMRFFQQVTTAFIGAHIVLLPGVIIALVLAVRRKKYVLLMPLIWVVLHWLLYAVRLPVTFQHGRYIMPTIPFLVIFGVWGLAQVFKPRSRNQVVRLVSIGWAGATVAVFPAVLLILGAPAYSRDVAFIDNDIVASARWLQENTDEDTLIALHDIGAVGYFAPRPLLDLAGLVSPTVIPFMNDEAQLLDYIIEQEAQYLIVFPRWSNSYIRMVADQRLCEIWSADEQPGYVPSAEDSLGPMTVYQVTPDGACPP